MAAPAADWRIGLLRSGPCPCPGGLPGWWTQFEAVLYAIGWPMLVGGGLVLAGVAVSPLAEWAEAIFKVSGTVLALGGLLSGLGHLPGALVLRGMIAWGLCGWISAALAGLAVGALCVPLLGIEAPIWVGPVAGPLHLVLLRREVLARARDPAG